MRHRIKSGKIGSYNPEKIEIPEELQEEQVPEANTAEEPKQEEKLIDKARQLEQILRDAEIKAHFSNNIIRDALQKFAFVSPAAAAGSYFDVTCENFQHPGEERDTFTGLIKEVVALGKAMGVEFEQDLVEVGLKMMDALKPDSTMSMQRDIQRGRQSEFSGLVTRVVSLGKEYGVSVPLYEKINDWGAAKSIK